jgi:hypothetical protein
MLVKHPNGLAWRVDQFESQCAKVFEFATAEQLPKTESLDQALQALQIYYDFSLNTVTNGLAGDFLKTNPDWYKLGLDDLVAASKALQNFNLHPSSQAGVADKLTALRALARQVDAWIAHTPSIHDSYFIADSTVTSNDDLNAFEENPSIFNCEVVWGYLWQDRPEDGLALYRELMTSLVFTFIHEDLWLREVAQPRLAAWNDHDRQHLPETWAKFIDELKASTNGMRQLEGLALTLTDATNEPQTGAAFTNFFNRLLAGREALITNGIDVLYQEWGTGGLVSARFANGIGTRPKEAWVHLYNSEYRPKLEAMSQTHARMVS